MVRLWYSGRLQNIFTTLSPYHSLLSSHFPTSNNTAGKGILSLSHDLVEDILLLGLVRYGNQWNLAHLLFL